MKKLLLQFVLMSMAVLVHATQQIITLPPINGNSYVGCEVNGPGGNDINNTAFLQVPATFPSARVTMLMWNCTGFNQYVYLNCADSPSSPGHAGWYNGSLLANVSWNPGQGVVIRNTSSASSSFTLNGTMPIPVLPPTNSCPCGEWSFLSSQTNGGTVTYQEVMGVPPMSGSEVAYTYSGSSPVPTAIYSNGSWTPATPILTNGLTNAQAAFFYVPCATTNCITITISNLVANAPCNRNCVIVPLTATAIDNCCSNLILQYYEGGASISATDTCFSVGTNPVTVVATDACGNSVTNTFEVIVEPLSGITIQSSSETVYTCTNCTTVPFQVTVSDPCCSNGATVFYDYPTNYCFPANSTTPVTVFATDGCGNSATNTLNVTVIQVTNAVIISCPTNIIICTNTGTGAIIADSDEWALSDSGFNNEGDGAVYADNCAAYLTGGRGTNILIYSSDFGLDGIPTGGMDFTNALKNAGYSVTVDTPPTPTLTLSYLSMFNAVFVGGDALTTNELLALEAYVCDGGGVYVAAGTGRFGPAPVEAGQWNILLNPFGLTMANTYNGITSLLTVGGGTLTVSSSPVMTGVSALYYNSGNDVSVIAGDPLAQIIAYSGTQGLIGVSACNNGAGNGCGVMPDETGLVIVSGGSTVTQSPPAGTIICSNTIVTFTVSNLCGEIIQTNVPCELINCASNNCLVIECTNLLASAPCNSNCVIVPLTATPIDTCCSNVTLQYYAGGAAIPATGNCFNVGTTPVTVVATDACGNSATNSFDVIVGQLSGITIQCTNETVYTCSNCTTVPFQVTVLDPCCSNGLAVSYSYPTNYCFPVNSTTPVTVFATDGCGNFATNTFDVIVLPSAPCSTNCITIVSSNLVAYVPCGSNCVVVPLTATPIDTCCSNVTLQYYLGTVAIPASGTCFNVGITPVTVVATDSCNNSATSVFDVIVQQVGGTITIHSTNETVITCSNCTMVPFQVTASDPCCSNNVTLSYDYPTNYCFQVNTTNFVEVFATDPCGNSNSASFTVTVLPCSTCCTNCNPPYPLSYSVTVNPGFNYLADNLCQGTNAITDFLTNAPNGSQILLWNGSGYTVASTRARGSWNPSLSLVPGEGFVLNVPSGTAPLTITISGCEPSCPPPCVPTNGISLVGTLGIITNATWTNLFSCPPPCGAEMQLWNPTSGSFTTYNYANGVWTPSVPVLAVGESAFVTVVPCTNCITIACSNLLASAPCVNCVPVPLRATAIDNCCSNVTLQYYAGGTVIPATNNCFNLGTTLVTVVATDGCGNSATNSFNVTVQQVGGFITIQYTNETVFTCSNCTTVPFQVTALDPCCSNNVTLSYDYPTNYCFQVNTTNIVEVFATDPCGNSNNASFTVTVLPSTNCCVPTITSSNLLAFAPCGSNCVIVPLTATVIDNCCSNNVNLQYYEGGISITSTGTCFNVGTTPVKVVATDGCGHSATNTFNVIVQQVGGFITIQTTNETVFTCSNCTMVPFQVTASDPCCSNKVTLSYDYPTNYCFQANTTNILEVFATDPCGNSNNASFTVTVLGGCVPPPTNMVLWLPFDATIGTITANLASPGNTGTEVGGPTEVSGYVDNSLSFNGSQYVSVPDYSAIDPGTSQSFTLDAWVNRGTAGPNSPPCVVLDKRDPASGNGYGISVYFGNVIVTLSGNNYSTSPTYSNVVPADGLWHFIAVTVIPGSPGAGEIYVDGKPPVPFAPVASNLSTTAPFLVGKSNLGGNQPWQGDIDEVEMYGRALSQSEVAAIYNAGPCGKCKPPCGITILSSNLLASVPCGSNCVIVPLTATAIDNCCSNNATLQYYEGTISISPAGTCFNVGTTPVKVVATDGCGNTATNSFNVIVQQVGGFITIQTTNETVFTCSNCTMVPFQVTASDPCCTNKVTLSYDYPTNYCFQVKTTNTVEVFASDPCGATNNASFTVTVLPATNCPPCLQFNCLTNLTVQCGTLWTSTPPKIVSSCCPSNSVFLLTSVTNGTCPKYITNSWRISDSCGDTDSCTQVVTVEDTNPPVITGGTNSVTGIITTNCEMVIPLISVTATDSCTPQCSLGQFQSPTNGTIVPGTNFYVTVTVTDLCGNAAQAKVLVQGVYKRGLVVIWPTQLISSNCLVPCVNPTIEDCSCGTNISIKQSPQCDMVIGPGQYRIQVIVKDCHGLTVTTNIPLTEVSTETSFLNVLTNTGIAANGTLLPQCAVDPHYTLGPVTTNSPGGCTLLGYTAPHALAVNNLWPRMGSGASEWISPNCQPPQMNHSPYGFYTYTNRFVLPQGLDASSASIAGRWVADDGAVAMIFNGTVTSNYINSSIPGWRWTAFTIDGNFLPYPQVNTVLFVVTNNQAAGCSPTGLRVEYLAANACSTCAPPAIVSFTTPPNPLHNGSSATFNVQADGTPPLTYQWLFNGTSIPGANGPSLHINHLTWSSAGTYTVIVSDPCGSATNSGRISVVPGLAYTNAWYTFDNLTNPLSATFGPDLVMNDINSGTNFTLSAGNTEDLGLPNPGGQIVDVVGINPLWPDTLTLPPVLPAGSTSNTDYTVIMDIYQPDTSVGTPSTLFESAGDGSGIALTLDVSNYLDITGTAAGAPFDVTSTMAMSADTWHRLALVVSGPVAGVGGSVLGYLDGVPFNTGPTLPFNCPCCVLNINSGIFYTNSATILSGTNTAIGNGELYISGLQFHTVALAPQIIAAMSGPDSGPQPNVTNLSPPSSAPALSAGVAGRPAR